MEDVPMIYKSIIDVMKKVNAIGKDRKNTQQNFAYRGIDDVMNELHSALSECGVFVVPEVLEENRSTGKSKSGGELYYTRLKIRFTFYAADGSYICAVVIGEAMDSGDKASNKALSIGLKYAMLQVFCIPTEDEKDPDAQSPQPSAGSMRPAPAKKQPAKFDFEPKGGETTAEEKKEIGALLVSKYPDGKPVFTKDEVKAFSDMRRDYTAAEVIAKIKEQLQARITPTATMKKASELPPVVEAVKNAVDGEVVETPAEPAGESENGFEIY
jgi:hypothetical protein